ncbi:acetylornithine aminotransferase apoenzyme [Thermaerobacter marianensis DSM 12885]|uniref:Acetylornithine aminotransferase n=1 Tax=Thermaerobacter marianensis (strain ATCC 700841 / DSM 12885 / JCM 10246 / 7p75a) TaxID=644966 RepID=E6SH27_THEM7|nr:aspartate aminotransferase family protein [Thermaerobacter marianensis]ADU50658.1 acetylornithine aminotransferase apoenzyme [Thermaerobacter marianensis DSM 12885]
MTAGGMMAAGGTPGGTAGGPAQGPGSSHLFPNYRRLPVAFVRGEGAWLYDAEGRAWLDCTSGIGVTVLGHAHPVVTEAIRRQAGQLLHCSNLYRIPQQEELARRLAARTGLDCAFFANSGAEANEAAIKLARRYWWLARRGAAEQAAGPAGETGEGPEIIAFEGSFHGRTLGALAATGQPHYHEGFHPLPGGFRHVPFNDLEAVAAAITPRTCAILVEPVQGEGGVVPAAPGFLAGLRELCDRHGLLLIADEVQTGCGRTGTFLAMQGEGVRPDVVTLAKALANGVPIGAMLAGGHLAEVLGPGTHASTFGGNPLAATAALATLDVLERENLPERAAGLGEYLRTRLAEVARRHPGCQGVRGRGLMLGLVLDGPAAPVVEACFAEGLLVTVAGGRVVRFLPPLTVTVEELDQAVERLERALARVSRATA